jgi:PilZ domain-containing protein
MGQRREPRKDLKVPVRVFGTDIHGKPFSENLNTHNVSNRGARVGGLQANIKPGEIIGMTYGTQKSRFTVRWVGGGDSDARQLGLENASPEKPFWDFPLPAPGMDEFGRHSKGTERRKHSRLKCLNSIELYPEGEGSKIWGKAVDLSMGGCFVEMPMPLKEGTKLKIILWVKDEKLLIKGKVVSSRPGFGIGVQYTEIGQDEALRLRQFLQSITRLPI